MNLKIWPRSKKETGGYACMPLKGNITQGSRGQKIIVEAKVREDKGGRRIFVKKEITYTVKQLFPYCILLEDKHGLRICPSYARLEAMQRGEEEE